MSLSSVLIPLITLSVLQANAIGPAASVQYDQALLEFLLWLHSQGVWRVRSLPGVDLCLVRYFDELSLSMAPYAVGEKTLAACGHRTPYEPGPLSTKFPGASRALKGWKRVYPCRTRAPLPFLAMLLAVASMLLRGQRQMALGVLLAFSGYLRPSELSGLKSDQVVEPQEFGGAHFKHLAIVLHHFSGLVPSKTGVFDESILLDSPWFGEVATMEISRLARSRSAGAPVWSWQRAGLRAEWTSVMQALRFDKNELTVCLYGLRHGGASHDTLNRLRALHQVKERGRWVTDASVHRYRKASLAQSELAKLTSAQQTAGRLLSRSVDRMLSDPVFLRKTMAGLL